MQNYDCKVHRRSPPEEGLLSYMCVHNHLPFHKHLSVAVTIEAVASHSQASKCLDSYKCNYLLSQAVEETGLSRGQIQSLFSGL